MIALYHSDPDLLEFSAEVRACAPVAGADDLYDVVLSNTAFYPTGGGQPCDAGTLDGFPVEDVSHEGDLAPIVHRGARAAPALRRRARLRGQSAPAGLLPAAHGPAHALPRALRAL